MNWANMLAGIGVVLTLLIGVPSTVALLQGGNTGLGVLVLLLSLIVLAMLIGFGWYIGLPNWTVLHFSVRLVLHDDEGKSATFRKTLRLRPNKSGQQTYIHRNLSADGEITNFRVDDDVDMTTAVQQSADWRLPVVFKNQKRRWKECETWLAADFVDCFTKKRESFTLLVEPNTRDVELEVEFPTTSSPRDPMAIFRSSGMETELDPPPVINGTTLTWSITRRWRPLSGEYEIFWEW